MAGLTHLGVGLAAKQIAPNVNAGILVAAAYAIDIVWTGFWVAGIEKSPTEGLVAPWSHGLFMSVLWSVAAGLLTWLISRHRRTSLIIGLLVFSHWIVDFIAKPMLHAFPMDVGLPLLFAGSPEVGLGLWGTAAGEFIGEYVVTTIGAAVYVAFLIRARRARQKAGVAA